MTVVQFTYKIIGCMSSKESLREICETLRAFQLPVKEIGHSETKMFILETFVTHDGKLDFKGCNLLKEFISGFEEQIRKLSENDRFQLFGETFEGFMNGILKLKGFPERTVSYTNNFTTFQSYKIKSHLLGFIFDCTKQEDIKELGDKLFEMMDDLPPEKKLRVSGLLGGFLVFYGMADERCLASLVNNLYKCCEILDKLADILSKESFRKRISKINKELNNASCFFLYARHSNPKERINCDLKASFKLRRQLKEDKKEVVRILYDLLLHYSKGDS